LIVKKFYSNKRSNVFKYQVIDEKISLSEFIVITNKDFDLYHLKKSQKRSLIARLDKENYKIIKEFRPPEILYQVMGDGFDFYSSGIVPIWTVSIYRQDKNPQN